MTEEIWVWLENHQERVDDSIFGLLEEAAKWRSGLQVNTDIVVIAFGSGMKASVEQAGLCDADRVVLCDDPRLDHYQGETYVQVLAELYAASKPGVFFMAESGQTRDLAPRLAAQTDSVLITRAVDLRFDPEDGISVVRPVANGFLFEEQLYGPDSPMTVNFIPSVLSSAEPNDGKQPEMVHKTMNETVVSGSTRLLKVLQASPAEMALEDADIIVAAGRGVGKEQGVAMVKELADTMGASVGATRPVVDWGAVAFERQIGQTGKTVVPELIINCGISGANEYTAGMEKSQHVIAINTDARARIFRFADLGVVADARELLPVLIEKIKRSAEDDNQG
ncbi:MAG: electron transfer flavoprotein subunit alpha/FixB family protein [Deltaproteobacteria bacterium]|jgi:electron transfer flavoprotein alpha subunit|nr:electron transfer flavoprotein subunit alpha/FixB family protein [Deltaproteobacteria bacterium]MBT6504404.1 electron transfer flavoprotein subunit alpha/FixB family protein [Deltaproteobacteria bacterium]MBT7713799.1 electron transfer flavoprotein subunit alpha/FixB family protein [Deltaproteobacteria bacterium]